MSDCQVCNAPTSRPKYCSTRCKDRRPRLGHNARRAQREVWTTANCELCGAEYTSPTRRNQRYCSKACARTGKGVAIGSTRKGPDGYVKVKTVEGWRLEHRVVIEAVIGRPLDAGWQETVHHRNGQRDDNRPSNLELRIGNHGSGQSVEDRVDHAVEVLRRYQPDLLVRGVAFI